MAEWLSLWNEIIWTTTLVIGGHGVTCTSEWEFGVNELFEIRTRRTAVSYDAVVRRTRDAMDHRISSRMQCSL